MAVVAPDPGADAEKRVALTFCRKCKARIIALTHEDGTVNLELSEEDAESQPLPVATTLDSVFDLAAVVRIPFALWQPRGEAIGEFKHRAGRSETHRSRGLVVGMHGRKIQE